MNLLRIILSEETNSSALDEEAVIQVEKTLQDRKLSALWITHSDEQERRVATRTIHLGPREGGGSINSRNTSVNADIDSNADAESISGDSLGVLRKKRSAMRRTRSREQANK
jgi:hypothetical protein